MYIFGCTLLSKITHLFFVEGKKNEREYLFFYNMYIYTSICILYNNIMKFLRSLLLFCLVFAGFFVFTFVCLFVFAFKLGNVAFPFYPLCSHRTFCLEPFFPNAFLRDKKERRIEKFDLALRLDPRNRRSGHLCFGRLATVPRQQLTPYTRKTRTRFLCALRADLSGSAYRILVFRLVFCFFFVITCYLNCEPCKSIIVFVLLVLLGTWLKSIWSQSKFSQVTQNPLFSRDETFDGGCTHASSVNMCSREKKLFKKKMQIRYSMNMGRKINVRTRSGRSGSASWRRETSPWRSSAGW